MLTLLIHVIHSIQDDIFFFDYLIYLLVVS